MSVRTRVITSLLRLMMQCGKGAIISQVVTIICMICCLMLCRLLLFFFPDSAEMAWNDPKAYLVYCKVA